MRLSRWFPFKAAFKATLVPKKGFPSDFLRNPFLSTKKSLRTDEKLFHGLATHQAEVSLLFSFKASLRDRGTGHYPSWEPLGCWEAPASGIYHVCRAGRDSFLQARLICRPQDKVVFFVKAFLGVPIPFVKGA